ncbi:hypothetical protein [Nonomuraea sp. NEAU-A123]|uniref:hypothetical protein n=1 Tax=Nonomuraea sp. NEAU-A123 TaxID=2839649 RepID=UPI001BE3ED25|nr:hypothetical protein [Nonomuraea sp. NEAU-A123]MBT2229876.1 hypothetical protein [Nonomuraea sp. NEAU-A123]
MDLDDFLDRHPHAAFPVAATFIGLAPAVNLPELAWYGSRFWTGAVIGTVLAIGPTVLICVRRTRAWGGAVLFLAAATAAFVCLAPSENPYAEAGVVELRSSAATFLVWSSAVLFGIGIAAALRTDRGAGHLAWVETSGTDYRAACGCGWRGEIGAETAAFGAAGDHANRVSLQVQPPQEPW